MTDLANETGLSKKIGYEYNALAAGFASGKSRMIGIAVDVENSLGTTYFARVFKAALSTLQEAGYRALLLDTVSEEFASGEKLQRLIKQRRVEGLLAVAPPTKDQSFVSSFSEGDTSTVLIGNKAKRKGIPAITFDNTDAIKLLVNHLVELGHKKVAFIKGNDRIVDSAEREKAFLKFREKHNLAKTASYIVQKIVLPPSLPAMTAQPLAPTNPFVRLG